jgi:glyoxylase-like metal-dependent hydrolase (beta-lactamase superfamily II)
VKELLRVLIALGVLGTSVLAQSGRELQVVPVRGPISLIGYAGANITVSVGHDGVFVVDTGAAQHADKVLAAIQQLQKDFQANQPPQPRWGAETRSATNLEPYYRRLTPPKPIRYVANTSALADHTGGNEKLVLAGTTFTGGNVAGQLSDVGVGAALLSHVSVLHRLDEAKAPTRALPTETYIGSVMKLSHFFNGEAVTLIHTPAASTDGDSFVHFRGSDVIVTGELFDFTRYPLIDVARGGSIQGLLNGLNRLVELAVPEFRSEGGTLFVPAHGRIGDIADLTYYRDMMTIIRDRVQDAVKKGRTLEQIKAARPTEDWDPRFGQDKGWTPEMFVEAVYRGLVKK